MIPFFSNFPICGGRFSVWGRRSCIAIGAKALQTQSTTETSRQPPVPADHKNKTTHLSRTREVSSRYRSPTLSAANGPKRCPSPNTSRTSPTSTVLAPKRAISAERKRPSRPSSPPSPTPSTPMQDTSAEMLLASKKVVGSRLPESLWPSTMRSLSVSFQSDTVSVPTSKKEKPVSHTLTDRTLRPSSNITRRQAETTPASRKPAPERKSSPMKGKNYDKSENSKPVDTLHTRIVDQHRWPSRIGGKVSSGTLNRSIDLPDRINRNSSLPHSGTGVTSLRRLSLDGASKPLQKSSSDLLMLLCSDDSGNRCSIDASSLSKQKFGSSSSSDRTLLLNSATKAQSVTNPRSRPPSPSPSFRGVSPSRTKGTNPSRAPSPSQARPSSPSRQPQSSASVLSFMVDVKKGKKAANHIEDVHQLRLLYNRHLQWRYANARTDAALHSQKVKAELTGLNEWASVERDHTNSLTAAIQDLHSSTIRIPVTGGAKGDIETMKAAVCSAVDVMQAMGSSLCSILPKVEGMNHLVSELADIAAQERALLDEYESLMGSSAAFQVEEHSLRTHILQMKHKL
ncbi:AUGMIN subunit 8 isoform X3 [Primulina huaijiensis]|uniref:AUGMIN subunit 8 isoform X3 n=1 Tax=Primulina huaijiensis TaxID=1492673 RepID=UPI003CC75158